MKVTSKAYVSKVPINLHECKCYELKVTRQTFLGKKRIEPGSPAQEGRASSIQPLGLSGREDYILMVSIPKHIYNPIRAMGFAFLLDNTKR